MSKAILTGGAGFIGSHVGDALLAAGHSVAVIDDLNDFYDPAIKMANIAGLARAGARFYRADVRNKAEMDYVFAQEKPDVVFHLAARAGVRPSLDDPELYVSTNVLGTLHVLEAMRAHSTPKLIFASSSSVYGERSAIPFRESDVASSPMSPYAATKLAGEQLIYTYSRLFGLKAVCLRFFTVYGPRQRPDLAIHKFYRLMRAGKAVPVYGDGTAGRDYTFIHDIVRGVLSSLALDTSYEVINLGGARPVLLKDLVQVIGAVLGMNPRVLEFPAQAGDVPITCADTAKAGRLLGYAPAVALEQGMQIFHDWYESVEAASRGAIAAGAVSARNGTVGAGVNLN
jgi:UDP-glucuronate 4-epimerase